LEVISLSNQEVLLNHFKH